MHYQPSSQAFGPAVNRFLDVMAHSDRYAFKGSSRLAFDASVSPASVSRLIHSQMNPSFLMVARLTAALEKELGYQIDPRDVIAESGRFLTRSCCDLAHCRGCLPGNALDEFGNKTPEFEDVEPGTWVTSAYPKGFTPTKH
ncbi:MAG TPA: hypothetical protein VGL56_04445 [Fimbriimonadaceae bacterium]